MLHRIIRWSATVSMFTVLTFMAATTLQAECDSPEWDPDEIVCTSCGERTCCHGHWHGDELIEIWCHPA